MEKFYYYSFAFLDNNGKKETHASVYIGYGNKKITMLRIREAKKNALVSDGAVLLSCCYLGKMTEEEMTKGTTKKLNQR